MDKGQKPSRFSHPDEPLALHETQSSPNLPPADGAAENLAETTQQDQDDNQKDRNAEVERYERAERTIEAEREQAARQAVEDHYARYSP